METLIKGLEVYRDREMQCDTNFNDYFIIKEVESQQGKSICIAITMLEEYDQGGFKYLYGISYKQAGVDVRLEIWIANGTISMETMHYPKDATYVMLDKKLTIYCKQCEVEHFVNEVLGINNQ